MGSAEIQGKLWGAEPNDWATLNEPQNAPLFKAMLDATNVGSGTRILDAGCGGGGASVLAVERGAKVTGIDAAEGLIELARKAVPSGEFHVGDIQSLPFDDDAFDVVFAANSVQYADDLGATLRELGRVCVDGGHVVAGLFGPPQKVAFGAVFGAVKAVMPPPPPDAKPGGPFALSGPGVLEGFFKEAGLRVVDTGEADVPLVFENFDIMWRALVSAGPFQMALKAVSAETLKESVQGVLGPFTLEDGRIEIGPNCFIYVVASP